MSVGVYPPALSDLSLRNIRLPVALVHLSLRIHSEGDSKKHQAGKPELALFAYQSGGNLPLRLAYSGD